MTTKKPIRGRPELPDNAKKSVISQFRCTPEERALFEKMAAMSGKSLSDWVRDRAAHAALDLKTDPKETERTNFFQSLGGALTAWQYVEFFLFRLFAALLLPASENVASAAFFSIASFEGKLKMLENMGFEHHKADPLKTAEWRKLIEHCRRRNVKRNRLAHDMVMYDTDNKEVILHHGGYNQVQANKKGVPMKLSDLEKLHQEIKQLVEDIQTELRFIYEQYMLKQL